MNAKNKLITALTQEMRDYTSNFNKVCNELAMSPTVIGMFYLLDVEPYQGQGTQALHRVVLDNLPDYSRYQGYEYAAEFPSHDFIRDMADWLNERAHLTEHNVYAHSVDWCAKLILDHAKDKPLSLVALYCNACGGYGFDIYD